MKLIYDNINNYTQDDYDIFLNCIKKLKYDKIQKILNIDDKKRSILGEISLIKMLNKFGINYNSVEIHTNENGKPYIRDKKIYFNISHSNDYVVCVVSNKEIGVDIEKIRNVNINIIKQFATENEIKYIKSSKENILKKVFEIFALKEAYFKCLGTNLNNIKNIEFNINNNSIFCSDKNVNCSLNYEIDDYIIGICEKI